MSEVEDVLEPNLAICDPHHHLWDEPHRMYPRPYMWNDLMADLQSGHRVVDSVFVECRAGYRKDGPEAFRCVGEPEFVVASDPIGFIKGIVGFCDLRLAEAPNVLDALIEAGGGRLRGVRQISQSDPSPAIQPERRNPPGLLGDVDFRKGFASVARAGLSFDVQLYHPQIPELTDLARCFPEVTFILDHFGTPIGVGPYAARAETVRAQWQASMLELSGCANVLVKLDGMGMPVFGNTWHERTGGATSQEIAQTYRGTFTWLIELFGANRCMFASNFPADKASYSYRTLWNGFKRIAENASTSEKTDLFHDSAARAYRL